ncbi:hypothetical protein O6H91_11G023900 [Diphasiastrum complanatum]|nr:hypothetical protein O6H91_11G023900 [Diphasiastrum complanatum]
MAFFSVGLNLFQYLFENMHLSMTSSANGMTNFMGTSYVLSLLGGFISDTWLSRFTTLRISALIELLGLSVMALSASLPAMRPPPCVHLQDACQEAHGFQKIVLFVALYLIAIGSGGMKSNLPALGAEQFNDQDPNEQRELSNYFNWFFLSFIAGTCLAVTVAVYIQDNVSLAWGFGMLPVVLLMGVLVVSAGSRFYKSREHGVSPLTHIARVLVAAIRNRNLPPCSNTMLFEMKDEETGTKSCKIAHTEQFRFLDNAANKSAAEADPGSQPSSWKLCTVTQVEEVKSVIKILPIFASSILINCVLAQMQTFSLAQGRTMDRRIFGNFEIPPASMSFIPLAVMIVLLPLYDKFFVPFARRLTGQANGLSHLQRIGVGLFLSIFCMAVAALVETKRLKVVADHNLLDFPNQRVPMTVSWLVLQFLIFGIADIFTFPGQMEFFYSQSPPGMRSMATSLSFVSEAMGYFFSSVLVAVVDRITRRGSHKHGWLLNNLNRSKLHYFYWTLAAISLVNFLHYLFWAWWYKYREVLSIPPVVIPPVSIPPATQVLTEDSKIIFPARNLPHIDVPPNLLPRESALFLARYHSFKLS